mmetsp:Transcript_3387/g.21177  ORF Transcript_3387/g.21177 Transcript_3387/m.21177 type:complete len:107 (+) Transcript_3387:1328-1648(+)
MTPMGTVSVRGTETDVEGGREEMEHHPCNTPAQKPVDERQARGRFLGDRKGSPTKNELLPLLSCKMASCLPWMQPKPTWPIVRSHQGGKGDHSIAYELWTRSGNHS